MNVLQTISVFAESVDGGCAQSFDEIARQLWDIEWNEVPTPLQKEIEQEFFTCEICGWTMPRDDESDSPDLCTECEEESN